MPLKRNLNIVTLSKDHHFGLLFCWKIKEGVKNDISLERIKTYVDFFWTNHLTNHFKEEEELLFNLVNDPLCDNAIKDHQIIRTEINRITNNIDIKKDDFLLLTQLINLHIRFEERILFPRLEQILSEQQLEEIGKRLEKIHTVFNDDYEDEFWIKAL